MWLIGPDGKISYLEAQNVQAAGLTVDELREKLSSELGRLSGGTRALLTISTRARPAKACQVWSLALAQSGYGAAEGEA